MASFEKHIEKYRLFKKDAENKTVSHMSRIEAYFFASFHLIEAVMAKHGKHINKHTLLRSVLTKEIDIFKEDTETIWRDFSFEKVKYESIIQTRRKRKTGAA